MRKNHIETHLGKKSRVYTTERRIDDRQGRPNSFQPAFFSYFYFAELLSTTSLRFEMTLKLEVASGLSTERSDHEMTSTKHKRYTSMWDRYSPRS
jgi:hypothetical protein